MTWPGGRKFRVRQYRCLACGALDVVQRDWQTKHERDKPTPGRAMASDGRAFAASEHYGEEVGDG